ncbi:MAG: TRAP transporter small permease [Proteobacteria bacterium]|nr:TRAP transporter small permease [Pseudomonadota bacterium]
MKIKKIISALEYIDRCLFFCEKTMIYFLLLTMAGLSFYSVILRLLFDKAFVGCTDLVQNLVLWCTFLGGSVGARYNHHLSINIFQHLVKNKKIKTIIEIILFIGVAIVSFFLAWSGYRFVSSQYEFGEDLPSLGLKLWVFQIILPYTFAMVSYQYFLQALKRMLGLNVTEQQFIL